MKILSLLIAALFASGPYARTQTMVTLSPTQDATLHESSTGATANGSGQYFFVGRNAGGNTRRAVMAFDVAGSVPAGATITSVTLRARCSRAAPGSGNQDLTLHPLTASWSEGPSNPFGQEGSGAPAGPGDVTWIHRNNPGLLWTTAGGDFVAAASATTTVGFAGLVYTWSSAQMASDVQGWLDNPATSFGWLFKSSEVGSSTAKRFDSLQSPFAGNRPSLDVTYVTASAVQVGTGCLTSAGTTFTLGTNGLPLLGNATFALTLSGGPATGNADLYLANGMAAVPTPIGAGCNVYLDLPSVLSLLAAGVSPLGPFPLTGGAFTLPIPLPNDPNLNGLSFHLQALAPDTVGVGIVLSNGLSATIGS